jgi:5'-nucleotidase
MRILLTNDDGIDAPGLRALADALAEVGEVTVLAPARNQSAVGRGLSYGRMGPDGGNEGEVNLDEDGEEAFTVSIPHESHDLGYAIHGTPCDCVILGTRTFDPDVVVAGCNPGANLGVHVLPRSGTASAAEEAACLGKPGIAVSMDVLGMDREELVPEDFERACRIGRRAVVRAVEGDAFAHADYLNVNVPRPDRELDGVALTRPTAEYDMHADMADDGFWLHNPLWAGMAEGEIPDGEGTDRRALLDRKVSVSPLSLRPAAATGAIAELGPVFDGLAE